MVVVIPCTPFRVNIGLVTIQFTSQTLIVVALYLLLFVQLLGKRNGYPGSLSQPLASVTTIHKVSIRNKGTEGGCQNSDFRSPECDHSLSTLTVES